MKVKARMTAIVEFSKEFEMDSEDQLEEVVSSYMEDFNIDVIPRNNIEECYIDYAEYDIQEDGE